MVFLLDVIVRVMAMGHRPSFGDHPRVQILATGTANCQNSIVSIAVFRFACDGAAADFVRKGERCKLPTRGAFTAHRIRLVAFRRIYAVQANPRSMNFERIAVDDRRTPNDHFGTSCAMRSEKESFFAATTL